MFILEPLIRTPIAVGQYFIRWYTYDLGQMKSGFAGIRAKQRRLLSLLACNIVDANIERALTMITHPRYQEFKYHLLLSQRYL
jgi:hypothetical protein